jgi:hypothetical protein
MLTFQVRVLNAVSNTFIKTIIVKNGIAYNFLTGAKITSSFSTYRIYPYVAFERTPAFLSN